MGPNGSGKSTLANAVMGHPNLEVTEGEIHFQRRGHHRGRARRAGPHGPVHGLPVPGRRARRDRQQVPAHGAERPPRRRAARSRSRSSEFAKTVRGAMELTEGPRGVLQALPQRGLLRRREEAHGDPPARAAAAPSSPCSTRPTPAWTSTRCASSPTGVNSVIAEKHDGRAHHHPLPAHPPPRRSPPTSTSSTRAGSSRRAGPSSSPPSRRRATGGSRRRSRRELAA